MPVYEVPYELTYSGVFTAAVDAPHEAERAAREYLNQISSNLPGATVRLEEAVKQGGIVEVGD